jgi:1-acyl-sn-glycerol-3-phosphate acyltransferase
MPRNEHNLRFSFFGDRVEVTRPLDALWTGLGGVVWLGLTAQVARALGRTRRRAGLYAWMRFWARGTALHLRLRLDLTGLEHVDSGQAYVVVALHEGFADVVALLHLPLNLRFVARDELFHWPLLGPILRDTGQFAICPEHGAASYRQLTRTLPAALGAEESLVMFPQGTILGLETDFMAGAFGLAHHLRRSILPVALTGAHRVWEHPYTPRLRFGERLSLRVLPAIPTTKLLSTDMDVLRLETQRHLKAVALEPGMASARRFVPERDGFWDGYAYRIDPDYPELQAKIQARRMNHQTQTP